MSVRSRSNRSQRDSPRKTRSFTGEILVSLVLFCLANRVSGQIEDLAFVRLGVTQGLPRANVLAMAPDTTSLFNNRVYAGSWIIRRELP
jgi:hypothetical protein